MNIPERKGFTLIEYGNLDAAYEAYWNATSRQQDQHACYAILLFGGKDGYPRDHSKVTLWLIRALRRLAMWLDRSGF